MNILCVSEIALFLKPNLMIALIVCRHRPCSNHFRFYLSGFFVVVVVWAWKMICCYLDEGKEKMNAYLDGWEKINGVLSIVSPCCIRSRT